MADTDVAEFENRLLKRVLLIIENEWRSVLHRWIGTLRRSPCGQRFPQHKRIEDQARNVWLADSRIVRAAERPPPYLVPPTQTGPPHKPRCACALPSPGSRLCQAGEWRL